MKKGLALLIALFLLSAACAESALPAYVCPLEDPVEAAVADWIVASYAEYLAQEEGSVTIPAPMLFRREPVDDARLRVYGTLWVMSYVLKDKTLECISAMEVPAVLILEERDGAWTVTEADTAGEGDDYLLDIARFAAGDAELEDAYAAGADLSEEPLLGIRTRYIRDYVRANGLDVTAYQDPYWEPVPLGE